MNGINNYLFKFCERPETREGDYLDDGGNICCGVCRQPRQFDSVLLGEPVKVHIPCECERAERERRLEEEAARRLAEQIERNRAACFPAGGRFTEMSFENADDCDAPAFKAAERFCERFDDFTRLGKGVIFFGAVGCGKTFLAACIANRLLDQGTRVIFTNLPRIVNRLQASFEGRNELFDELNRVPLLVLDDLRAERRTEFMTETLFNIIDGRYNSGLPLVVTTNMTAAELKQSGGDLSLDRVTSRLLEMCHPVEVTGQDRRREKLKSTFSETAALLGI